MKILFVTDYYYPHAGGVEEMIKNIAEGLAKRGHDVHVLTWKISQTKSEETMNDVKIHRYSATSRYSFLVLMLSKTFFLKQFDIIHTTTFSSIPTIFLTKMFGKPCFITISEIWGKKWFEYDLNPLLALAGYLWEKSLLVLPFDKVIVPSDYTKKCFYEHSNKKDNVVVIKHGIDYKLFDSSKYSRSIIRNRYNIGKDFLFLFYGRYGPTKGLEYLLNAIPTIVKRIPSSRFILIVSSNEAGYRKIKEIIRKNKCEENVELIKTVPRKELPYYISAADCVVVPSLNEGFGFAAAEACAMEKPIVVSKVASLPEVVSGKVAFAEPANPRSIAEACEKVYRKKYLNIPRKTFRWEDSVPKYIEIYKKFVKS